MTTSTTLTIMTDKVGVLATDDAARLFSDEAARMFSQFSAASLADPSFGMDAAAVAPPPERHNYCGDCDCAMELHESEYHCPSCGIIIEYLADAVVDHTDTTAANIRISTGKQRGRFYNVSTSYVHAQLKLIKDQLTACALAWRGDAISQNILDAAAAAYNAIQRTVEVDENGVVHKFVRRGNIKNEVLAAFLYYECIRAGTTRKKKDIAKFIQLSSDGFSRGDDIYRTVCRDNGMPIPVEIEPMDDFIERYLEALGLIENCQLGITAATSYGGAAATTGHDDTAAAAEPERNAEGDRYRGFIRDLVRLSERRRIGMNSHVSSKVVGALFILITQLQLPISLADLEAATDNTKKSTFMKFITAVKSNMLVFRPVYKQYNVPTTVVTNRY